MVVEATVNPNLIGTFKDDFANSNWSLKDGQDSPDGKWHCRYNGFGEVKVVTYKSTKAMKLKPAIPSTPTGTRACSIVTRQKFKDFDMTFNMSTERQTRTNGNNWEVGWIFFSQTDRSHHYALHIQKDGGLQLSKKDYDIWEEREVFLKVTSNDQPKFRFSRWYQIRIKKVGYHIEVWVDGVKFIDIIDDGTIGNFGKLPDGSPRPRIPPSAQIAEGFIGPYCEDAEVYYDRFVINPL